jgi:tRNA pseudouridine55 synthase
MHGVINLDKPKGITSHDAVTLVKRLLGVRKAGHAGTLDPIATGVLLVCVGEATKISSYLMDLPKEYLTTVKLGERTDTFDAEGEVVKRLEKTDISLDDIEKSLDEFRGTIRQKPPMYSAVKVGGQPLYKLARKGQDIDRVEREVTAHAIEVEEYSFPFITLRLSCSRGFYVRALADDLGRALGTVAHMYSLRRTAVGTFHDHESVLPENPRGLREALVPVDRALLHLKEVVLGDDDYLKASNGMAIESFRYGKFNFGEVLRMKGPDGVLIALSEASGPRLKVRRGLNLGLES